ncbi:hypothetical protein IFM12275_67790 [Nocardia sputorum]|nr:hypothetical protein IFM12275_67790 [Nocardia sputorum]
MWQTLRILQKCVFYLAINIILDGYEFNSNLTAICAVTRRARRSRHRWPAPEAPPNHTRPDHERGMASHGRIPAARRSDRPRDNAGLVGEYPDAASTERPVGFAPQSRPPNADSHENTDHNVHHGR